MKISMVGINSGCVKVGKRQKRRQSTKGSVLELKRANESSLALKKCFIKLIDVRKTKNYEELMSKNKVGSDNEQNKIQTRKRKRSAENELSPPKYFIEHWKNSRRDIMTRRKVNNFRENDSTFKNVRDAPPKSHFSEIRNIDSPVSRRKRKTKEDSNLTRLVDCHSNENGSYLQASETGSRLEVVDRLNLRILNENQLSRDEKVSLTKRKSKVNTHEKMSKDIRVSPIKRSRDTGYKDIYLQQRKRQHCPESPSTDRKRQKLDSKSYNKNDNSNIKNKLSSLSTPSTSIKRNTKTPVGARSRTITKRQKLDSKPTSYNKNVNSNIKIVRNSPRYPSSSKKRDTKVPAGARSRTGTNLNLWNPIKHHVNRNDRNLQNYTNSELKVNIERLDLNLLNENQSCSVTSVYSAKKHSRVKRGAKHLSKRMSKDVKTVSPRKKSIQSIHYVQQRKRTSESPRIAKKWQKLESKPKTTYNKENTEQQKIRTITGSRKRKTKQSIPKKLKSTKPRLKTNRIKNKKRHTAIPKKRLQKMTLVSKRNRPKARKSKCDPYICSICLIKFQRQIDGKVHELTHSKRVPVLVLMHCRESCFKDPKPFSTESEIENHNLLADKNFNPLQVMQQDLIHQNEFNPINETNAGIDCKMFNSEGNNSYESETLYSSVSINEPTKSRNINEKYFTEIAITSNVNKVTKESGDKKQKSSEVCEISKNIVSQTGTDYVEKDSSNHTSALNLGANSEKCEMRLTLIENKKDYGDKQKQFENTTNNKNYISNGQDVQNSLSAEIQPESSNNEYKSQTALKPDLQVQKEIDTNADITNDSQKGYHLQKENQIATHTVTDVSGNGEAISNDIAEESKKEQNKSNNVTSENQNQLVMPDSIFSTSENLKTSAKSIMGKNSNTEDAYSKSRTNRTIVENHSKESTQEDINESKELGKLKSFTDERNQESVIDNNADAKLQKNSREDKLDEAVKSIQQNVIELNALTECCADNTEECKIMNENSVDKIEDQIRAEKRDKCTENEELIINRYSNESKYQEVIPQRIMKAAEIDVAVKNLDKILSENEDACVNYKDFVENEDQRTKIDSNETRYQENVSKHTVRETEHEEISVNHKDFVENKYQGTKLDTNDKEGVSKQAEREDVRVSHKDIAENDYKGTKGDSNINKDEENVPELTEKDTVVICVNHKEFTENKNTGTEIDTYDQEDVCECTVTKVDSENVFADHKNITTNENQETETDTDESKDEENVSECAATEAEIENISADQNYLAENEDQGTDIHNDENKGQEDVSNCAKTESKSEDNCANHKHFAKNEGQETEVDTDESKDQGNVSKCTATEAECKDICDDHKDLDENEDQGTEVDTDESKDQGNVSKCTATEAECKDICSDHKDLTDNGDQGTEVNIDKCTTEAESEDICGDHKYLAGNEDQGANVDNDESKDQGGVSTCTTTEIEIEDIYDDHQDLAENDQGTEVDIEESKGQGDVSKCTTIEAESGDVCSNHKDLAKNEDQETEVEINEIKDQGDVSKCTATEVGKDVCTDKNLAKNENQETQIDTDESKDQGNVSECTATEVEKDVCADHKDLAKNKNQGTQIDTDESKDQGDVSECIATEAEIEDICAKYKDFAENEDQGTEVNINESRH